MTAQTDANIETVKAIYAALQTGNWDAYGEFLADDCVLHEAMSLPYGGTFIGRDAIVRATQFIFGTYDNFQFSVLNWLAGGDEVGVHVFLTGMGRKTGRLFACPLVEMWRLRNGKAVEIRPFYFDSARAGEVFG